MAAVTRNDGAMAEDEEVSLWIMSAGGGGGRGESGTPGTSIRRIVSALTPSPSLASQQYDKTRTISLGLCRPVRTASSTRTRSESADVVSMTRGRGRDAEVRQSRQGRWLAALLRLSSWTNLDLLMHPSPLLYHRLRDNNDTLRSYARAARRSHRTRQSHPRRPPSLLLPGDRSTTARQEETTRTTDMGLSRPKT